MTSQKYIWVFHANKARFAGGVFVDIAIAESWIEKYKLSGILTGYPEDQGCYDWVLQTFGTTSDKSKLETKSQDPDFVGGFTSASQPHIHFENGIRA